jgi:hypothetical protein
MHSCCCKCEDVECPPCAAVALNVRILRASLTVVAVNVQMLRPEGPRFTAVALNVQRLRAPTAHLLL